MSTKNTPTHPGEILLDEFLKPLEMSQRDLARRLHVEPRRVNELVRGKRSVIPNPNDNVGGTILCGGLQKREEQGEKVRFGLSLLFSDRQTQLF